MEDSSYVSWESMPDGSTRFRFDLRPIDIRRVRGTNIIPVPLVPDAFSVLIGHIAMSWGQYETNLDRFVRCLFAHYGTPLAEFNKVRSYKARVKLLREYAKLTFGAGSAITQYLHFVADTASPLAHKRNVLLHGLQEGRISYSTESGTPTASFTVLSTVTRADGTETIASSYSDLEDLFYAILSLSGMSKQLFPDKEGRSHTIAGLTLDQTRTIHAVVKKSRL